MTGYLVTTLPTPWLIAKWVANAIDYTYIIINGDERSRRRAQTIPGRNTQTHDGALPETFRREYIVRPNAAIRHPCRQLQTASPRWSHSLPSKLNATFGPND